MGATLLIVPGKGAYVWVQQHQMVEFRPTDPDGKVVTRGLDWPSNTRHHAHRLAARMEMSRLGYA